MTHDILIHPDGTIQYVYADVLEGVFEGPATVRRASHVEPDPRGGWSADLALVGGPVLGPYPTRAQALTAEIGWLEAEMQTRKL